MSARREIMLDLQRQAYLSPFIRNTIIKKIFTDNDNRLNEYIWGKEGRLGSDRWNDTWNEVGIIMSQILIDDQNT